jgi:hypothetical protein
VDVIRKIAYPPKDHTVGNPPANSEPLVPGEIDPVRIVQNGEQLL